MTVSVWLLLPVLLLPTGDKTSGEARRLNDEGVRLYEQKKYVDALKAFQRARALDGKSEVIAQNLGRCILEIGSAHLRDGELTEAVENLDRAVKLLPGEGEAHYRLGVALLQRKEYGDAAARLEHARRLSPKHGPAHLWLGRCYYEMGSLDEALEALEEALRLKPDEETKEFLEKVRREARIQKDFHRERSSNFTLEFSGEVPREVRDDVRRVLEDAYAGASRLLDYYPRVEIPAILYSEKEFRDATGSHDWVGGIYDGKIRIPVKDYEEHEEAVRRVAWHEVAHALLREGCKDIPIWFNEGFAQYLDGTDRSKADRVARDLVAGRGLPGLERIAKGLRARDRDDVSRAYSLALSFVSFLARSRGESRFGHLIYLSRLGQTFPEAFRSSYGMDPDEQVEKWEESLRR